MQRLDDDGDRTAPRTAASAASPDDLYAELLTSVTSERKRAGLAALWAGLEHLREVGSRNFSQANVARTVQRLGYSSPKHQTIRNDGATGVYQMLIRAFEEKFSGRDKAVADPDEALLRGIQDQQSAAHVRLLINENKGLKRRNDMLHAAFKRLAPVGRIPAELQAYGSTDAGASTPQTLLQLPASPPLAFSEGEVRAVRFFIDNLPQLDFELHAESGALLHRQGWEAVPPGFGQALLRIVRSAHSDGSPGEE